VTKVGREQAVDQGAVPHVPATPPCPTRNTNQSRRWTKVWRPGSGCAAIWQADAVLRNLRATGAFDQGSMETPTGPNREPLARERKKSRQCEPLPRAEGALGRIH